MFAPQRAVRGPSPSRGAPDAAGARVPGLRDLMVRALRWLAARRRARRDQSDLAQMSVRELRDIGLDCAEIHAAAWATSDWRDRIG